MFFQDEEEVSLAQWSAFDSLVAFEGVQSGRIGFGGAKWGFGQNLNKWRFIQVNIAL